MSVNGIRGFRGGNARNSKTTFPQVEARRASAAARKAVSDARSPEEQLAMLDRAGLVAAKERAKLAARIAARTESSTKPKKSAKGQAGVAPTP